MRRFLVPAAIMFVSLAIGLIVIEIAMRMLGIGYPLFTRADYWTGFSLRPGAEGWQRDEGEAYVKINSDGLRDVEHTKEKPADVYRIAVLGDSYTEARQVNIEKTFWSVMGTEMQSCPSLNGKKLEVINFGVSGFGTAQELLMMPHVWEYFPDLVLLAFTTGNDVRNNSYALEGNADKPYFYLTQGEMTGDFSFRDRPNYLSQTSFLSSFGQWMVSHSRILQVAYRAYSVSRSQPAPVAQVTASSSSSSAPATRGAELGLDDEVYVPPKTPTWEDAWLITELLLRAMNDDVTGHGAQFVVATLSNGIQVDPDPVVRQAYAKSLGVNDLLIPDRRIASVGLENSFMVILLAPVLQDAAQNSKTYMHGFENATMGEGHWNQNGHREAGQYLAKILCNSLGH
jgi:hypothetical protein